MHKSVNRISENNKPKKPQVKLSTIVDFEVIFFNSIQGMKNENEQVVKSLESKLQECENMIEAVKTKNE